VRQNDTESVLPVTELSDIPRSGSNDGGPWGESAHRQEAAKPTRPAPPSPAPQRSGSPLSAILVFAVGACVFAALAVIAGPALVVVAGIFALAALHFLVWGWWLGGAIERNAPDDTGRLDADKPGSSPAPPDSLARRPNDNV
jgi:hypothetical protein